MQLAEEKQSGWLQVPRIGYFAFPVTDVRGGVTQAEEYMDMAIKAAKAQWANGYAPDVEMIAEIFEPLEGELRFNERGDVEGPARVTFPDGEIIYEANYKGGQRHGQGTAKYANGAMYVGQYENDKKHGRGTYTWPNGNAAVLIFEEDRPKGPAVGLEKGWLFGHSYWLLKDGQKVRKISETEARSSFFVRFKLLFALAPGQRGGAGARPAGAPFVAVLPVMSTLFFDCKGRRSHLNSSKLSSKIRWVKGTWAVESVVCGCITVRLWQACPAERRKADTYLLHPTTVAFSVLSLN